MLSDGRFAIFGGVNDSGESLSSCEALMVDNDEHWKLVPPMHDSRTRFACVAVAGCVIVAGGALGLNGPSLKTAEVFDEVLDRWLRLPCDIPVDVGLHSMGSTLLYRYTR